MWNNENSNAGPICASEGFGQVRNDKNSIRVISITSGKGGVGKSNIVLNAAIALKDMGLKVLMLDGDFSLANIDILLNVVPNKTLFDVLHSGTSINDVIVRTNAGVDLIPSSSGIFEMSQFRKEDRVRLLGWLEALHTTYDILLIDTAAGISSDVIWLNASAHEIIVVCTPDPTSITDAYAMMKILHNRYKVKQVKLLVNQVKTKGEGLKVYNRISDVSDRFLNIGIDYLGSVIWDGCLVEAVRKREPVLTSFPNSASARGIREVAKILYREQNSAGSSIRSGSYFWRALVEQGESAMEGLR